MAEFLSDDIYKASDFAGKFGYAIVCYAIIVTIMSRHYYCPSDGILKEEKHKQREVN